MHNMGFLIFNTSQQKTEQNIWTGDKTQAKQGMKSESACRHVAIFKYHSATHFTISKSGVKSMEEKKGVSAIIYDDNGSFYFLIFHRVRGWDGWEFPKGGIKEGETSEEALVREVREETGLSKFRVAGKLDEQRIFEADGVKHVFDVFVVESSMNIPVTLQKEDPEHDTYLWATKDRVLEKLTWDEEKAAVEKAVEFIRNQ
jgi:bis(5'-nucleosidyl)-tetraphosphatase